MHQEDIKLYDDMVFEGHTKPNVHEPGMISLNLDVQIPRPASLDNKPVSASVMAVSAQQEHAAISP